MTTQRERYLGNHGAGKLALCSNVLAFILVSAFDFHSFNHGAELVSARDVKADFGQFDARILASLIERLVEPRRAATVLFDGGAWRHEGRHVAPQIKRSK